MAPVVIATPVVDLASDQRIRVVFTAENLALPMWAGIDAETQERVVSVIREAYATALKGRDPR